MNPSRRSFIKWSAGSVALVALNPTRLWAETKDPFAEFGLPAIGKLKPRSSASIKASPLGVGYETLDRQHFDPVKTYQHAAQLGVKWARCQTGWARTEKTKGQYDFGWLDEVVDGLLKIGIQPWFNLGYGNPLYTPQADETAVGWVPVFDEAAMDGWKKFTAKLAEHFKGRVTHWEIWNEANITSFWKPGKADAAAYTKLVAQTAPLIRERVPGAVIIGGAFAGVPHAYFKACLENGLAKLVDKIAYHPYRPIPEQGYDEDVRKLRQALKEHDAGHVALWQGEAGTQSEFCLGGALCKYPWTELTQAKWVTRRMLGDLGHDVESLVFSIADLDYNRWEGDQLGDMDRYGLVKTDKQYRLLKVKLAYYAVQNVVAVFDDTLERLPDDPGAIQCAKAAACYAYRHKPSGARLLVFWDKSAVPSNNNDTVSATLSLVKGSFQEPVWVDTITGGIFEIPMERMSMDGEKVIFKDIPVYDAPSFITEKSLLTPRTK